MEIASAEKAPPRNDIKAEMSSYEGVVDWFGMSTGFGG